jgi:hypothetical protein
VKYPIFFRMPRTRARRTDRGISQEVMEAASAEVISNNTSVRSVGGEYGIFHVSLHRSSVKLSKNDPPPKCYRPRIMVS